MLTPGWHLTKPSHRGASLKFASADHLNVVPYDPSFLVLVKYLHRHGLLRKFDQELESVAFAVLPHNRHMKNLYLEIPSGLFRRERLHSFLA